MSDKVYEAQLKAFGIESVRATESDVKSVHKVADYGSMLDVVKHIMSHMNGRQWLYSKLDMCGTFAAPIVPGDPYGSHVLSGMQAVGFNLFDDIMRASPENFYIMLQEAAARKQGTPPPAT